MNYEETITRLIDERKKSTTQKVVQEKSGIAQSYISKLEKVHSATPETIEKYAAALGYKVSIRLINEDTGEVIE